MSTQAVETSLPVRVAKQNNVHPLAPLNADEIKNAVTLIRTQWPDNTDIHFKHITLEEPAKAECVPYLEAEFHGDQLPSIDRRVLVTYYLRKTNKFHEAIANLSTQRVDYNVRLGPNLHAPGDGEEIIALERTALEDEGVKAEIAKLQLPEGASIVVDPWIYGRTSCNTDTGTER